MTVIANLMDATSLASFWMIVNQLQALFLLLLLAIRNLAHESQPENRFNYLNFHMEKSVSIIWISPCDSLGKFFNASNWSIYIKRHMSCYSRVWFCIELPRIYSIKEETPVFPIGSLKPIEFGLWVRFPLLTKFNNPKKSGKPLEPIVLGHYRKPEALSLRMPYTE